MAKYAVEISASARETWAKYSQQTQKLIGEYITRLITARNPRDFGKALKHHSGLWRYRVGLYRIICRLEAARLVILQIGRRDSIYKAIR